MNTQETERLILALRAETERTAELVQAFLNLLNTQENKLL